MKYWLSALIVTHLACTCYGDTVLQVSQEQIYLGDIWQGELIDIAVTVSNASHRIIELKDARASCGCMNVKLGNNRLKAGEATKLTAQIVRETPGRFKHRIIVATNDGNEQVTVTVAGSARKAYEVEGQWTGPAIRKDDSRKYHDMGALPNTYRDVGMGLRVRIHGLRPNDPVAKVAGSITVESSVFKLTEVKPSSNKDKTVQVDLRLDFTTVPEPGFYTCVIKFRIGDVRFSEKCSYRILGDIWTEPRQVNFGLINRTAKKRKSVRINFKNTELKWSDAEIARAEPAVYASAIAVTRKASNKDSLSVSLEIDPAKLPMMSSKNKGCFNVVIFIRDPEHAKGRNTGSEEGCLKMSLYGMVE